MASNFKIQNMPSLGVQVSQFSPKPMFTTFNFISRSTNLPQIRVSIPLNRLHCLSSSSSSPSPSPISENSSIEHPFEVSFLMNKFGWSPDVAKSRAKYLTFKTPERAERNMAFFKKHGFTETQISFMVKRYPRLLLGRPEKAYLPKLEFLWSLGLSRTETTNVVAKAPIILKSSLEKTVIPTYNLISALVNSDIEAVKMVKQTPVMLARNPEIDNIQILLEAGVPRANIAVSMSHYGKGRMPTPDGLRRMVEEVKEMGFDPCSMKFMYALNTFRFLSKSAWEDNVEVLKKYGWSDHHIFSTFEKDPKFIMYRKDKIEGVMDFLVNILGIEATVVTNFPNIFSLSLEKRIVPRLLVYQSIVEKGLCKRKFSIITLCSFSENQFLTRIIEPYENEAPELLVLYKETMNVKT